MVARRTKAERVAALTADIVLIAAAVAVTALVIRRESWGLGRSAESVAVENWDELVSDGLTIGRSDAPVKVVTFSDFQCAGCAIMHAQLRRLIDEYGGQVAVVYRHFPLPIHQLAPVAALAAECAAAHQRFEEFANALFEGQQWIGINEWTDYAKTAGIEDVAGFERCIQERDFVHRVKTDVGLGREMGVTSTPTVIVDGIMTAGMNEGELRDRIRASLEG